MVTKIKEVRRTQGLGHAVRVDVMGTDSDRKNVTLCVQPAKKMMLLCNVAR